MAQSVNWLVMAGLRRPRVAIPRFAPPVTSVLRYRPRLLVVQKIYHPYRPSGSDSEIQPSQACPGLDPGDGRISTSLRLDAGIPPGMTMWLPYLTHHLLHRGNDAFEILA